MISEKNKKIPVAGCRVSKGALKKGKAYLYKLIRAGSAAGVTDERFASLVVKNMPISSLRHIKNEVDTITKDMECGLRLDLSTAADNLAKQISESQSQTKNNSNDNPVVEPSTPDVTPETVRSLRFLPGDRLVCYQLEKVKQKTRWSPDGF